MSYLKKYEYVIEIAKSGGISQAAEQLGMSQPTLSKYLKKLEGELGVELFDRSTIPLRLTPAGERFVESGRKLIDTENQLNKQLEEIKSNKNSVITVGISPSRSPYLLPKVIKEFVKREPDSRIIVKEGSTSSLASMLNDGQLDLVISLLDDDTDSFERIELFEEDILLAAPVGSCTGLSALEILRSCELIQIGKGLSLWQTMSKITEALNIDSPKIECQSIESALALVKCGIGATIVPSYVERHTSTEDTGIRFLPLDRACANDVLCSHKRSVCLFYRKEQFLTSAEKKFIACVKQTI